MAVNKTAGEAKLGTSGKKAAVPKNAALKRAAVLKKAGPKSAVALKQAKQATRKVAPKKAIGPKLTAAQHELLKRIVANKDAKGYHTANKPEHRVLETLLKHKVVKKGPKHPETKYYHYQVSTIGKKYLESGAVPKS